MHYNDLQLGLGLPIKYDQKWIDYDQTYSLWVVS
jgi:hypothetical protein